MKPQSKAFLQSVHSSRTDPMPHLGLASRLVAMVLVVAALSSCSPELIAVPVTQAPTPKPQVTAVPQLGSPLIQAPGLALIRMLDEQNGWGISDKAVLRTADGGSTWHDVTPRNANTLGYEVTAEFLDTQHAWVLVPDANSPLAGTLDRTADGGATWSTIPAPFGRGVLRFLDANQGWMMASLGAGMGSMGVAVFQTKDAGSTWSQTYVNDPTQAGAGSSLPLGGLKDGLTPLDMTTAWIGGITYAPGKIYLYQTEDGGHTWIESPVKTPAGYEQAQAETTGPVFVGSKLGYLPVHLSTQNGIMLAIYVSRDGGASWLQAPTFIPLGGPADFVSEQAGFVWNGTNFYATKDGAQTWAIVSPDVAFGDGFGGMDFVSQLVGFVLTADTSGSRALYKTTDGGATWNLLAK